MFTKTSLFAFAALTAGHFQAATAIDYLGGWLPSPPKEQCVDICVNSKASPTCLTSSPECLAKKQRPFDYDYLLLEQIFVPQFCRDLLKGVDSTISHQNVNAYPNGITCKPEVVQSELTIHGLWPNYNDGYAGCCNVTDTIGNHPYNAAAFAKNQPELLAEMKTKWVDPTQPNEYDTLCEIYNHEFQKHGLCYGAYGDDYEKAAVTYFKATLNAANTYANATAQINTWAAEDQQAPSRAAIEALFPKSVQVLCSNVDGVNQLSAIRSCYEKQPEEGTVGPFNPIDCAPAAKTSAFIPCAADVPITLLPYTPPQ
ncbi:Ribonuclease, partial [Globisporangium splendens]